MRTALTAIFLLVLAGPVGASTLDYLDETYRFQGTPARDVLIVTESAGTVTFTDAEGTLAPGELPAGCEPVAANSVRCTQLPRKKTMVDGGDGDDELVGSRFEEFMIGGEGNDRLQPGLGADYLDFGDGFDTFDHWHDERDEGVVITTNTGPDSGDSFGAYERLIGTRHADSVIALSPSEQEIETRGGRDFITTAESYSQRSPGDTLECGRGVDLYRASYTDEDVIGCEAAGHALGEPAAGHLQVTYAARYLPGRALQFSGSAECASGGARCVLEIEVNGFGRTTRTLRPGRGAPLTHFMSRRDYDRAREKGKAVRRIRFLLRKAGFPPATAQLSRDIAP